MKNSQKIFVVLLALVLASFAIPSVGLASSMSVGPQRTLVILVRTQDADLPDVSKEQINDMIFNGQFNKFIKEASYNKAYFVGDVYGWFTLNRSMAVNQRCEQPSIDELSGIITKNKIVNNYDRILIIRNFCGGIHESTLPGMSIIGNKTFVSVTQTVLNPIDLSSSRYGFSFPWSGFDSNLAHELGHAFGLLHDNLLDCGLNIIPTVDNPCLNIEYGNLYDVMGSGTLALHYNALYKEMLGWLDPTSSKTVINSGNYTLSPLEDASTGIKLIKVQPILSDMPLYAIEYRRAIGFDSNLATSTLVRNQGGIIIYKIIDSTPQATQLLNMHPNQLPGKQKSFYVALGSGETFVDSDNGITIGPVTRTDDTGAVFDVSINQISCVHNAPRIEVPDSKNYIAQGGEIYPMIKITNQDNIACKTTQFSIRPTTAYSSFSFPAINKTIDILPGKSITMYIPLQVSMDAGMGNKAVNVLVINNTSGLSASSNIPIEVVHPPVITGLSVKSGRPGDIIEIIGENFTVGPNIIIDGQITFKTPDNLLAQYYNYTVDSAGRLYFIIPDKVYSSNFVPRKLIPTPDGKYIISLNANNGKDSNGITFTVSKQVSAKPASTINDVIKIAPGSRGTNVTNLQNYLIDAGYLAPGNNTGYYGNLTKTAVMKYKADLNSSVSALPTPTYSPVSTPTYTPTYTVTPASTQIYTYTPTPVYTPTPIYTPTYSSTPTPSLPSQQFQTSQTQPNQNVNITPLTGAQYNTQPTVVSQPSPTPTPVYSPTPSPTYTAVPTPVYTPSYTQTPTPTPIYSPTYTPVQTYVPTATYTPTPTYSSTPIPTYSPSPIYTATPTITPTAAAVPSPASSITSQRITDITNLYWSLLNRAPDNSGLNYFNSSSLTIDQIKTTIMNSSEYQQSHTAPSVSPSPSPLPSPSPSSSPSSYIFNTYNNQPASVWDAVIQYLKVLFP